MRELVPATRRVRSQRHGARLVKKTIAIEKRKNDIDGEDELND